MGGKKKGKKQNKKQPKQIATGKTAKTNNSRKNSQNQQSRKNSQNKQQQEKQPKQINAGKTSKTNNNRKNNPNKQQKEKRKYLVPAKQTADQSLRFGCPHGAKLGTELLGLQCGGLQVSLPLVPFLLGGLLLTGVLR